MSTESGTVTDSQSVFLDTLSVQDMGHSLCVVVPAAVLTHTSLEQGDEVMVYYDTDAEEITYVASGSPWEHDHGTFFGSYTLSQCGNSTVVVIPTEVVQHLNLTDEETLAAHWNRQTETLWYERRSNDDLFSAA